MGTVHPPADQLVRTRRASGLYQGHHGRADDAAGRGAVPADVRRRDAGGQTDRLDLRRADAPRGNALGRVHQEDLRETRRAPGGGERAGFAAAVCGSRRPKRLRGDVPGDRPGRYAQRMRIPFPAADAAAGRMRTRDRAGHLRRERTEARRLLLRAEHHGAEAGRGQVSPGLRGAGAGASLFSGVLPAEPDEKLVRQRKKPVFLHPGAAEIRKRRRLLPRGVRAGRGPGAPGAVLSSVRPGGAAQRLRQGNRQGLDVVSGHRLEPRPALDRGDPVHDAQPQDGRRGGRDLRRGHQRAEAERADPGKADPRELRLYRHPPSRGRDHGVCQQEGRHRLQRYCGHL